MEEQKVDYVSIENMEFREIEAMSTIGLSKRQWNSLKKKIDKEFDNDYGSYMEVRISADSNGKENNLNRQIDVEGHCILDRKRK